MTSLDCFFTRCFRQPALRDMFMWGRIDGSIVMNGVYGDGELHSLRKVVAADGDPVLEDLAR